MRFPKGMSLVVTALLILFAPAAAAEESPNRQVDHSRNPRPRLGMNLNGPADWNTELPFVDAFRLSRPWVSQQEGAAWGKGPPLELDEQGWVRRLQPGCWAESPLLTIDGGHYPAGRYTVLYDGEGRIEVWNAVGAVSREPGRLSVDVAPEKGGIHVKLLETRPENHVRNIRVVMPGFEKSFEDEPFHPVFLERWRGVSCLRFMDWMRTNGSRIRSWADRPEPKDATFAAKGVPLEVMIDLANRLRADPWFCMPHLADDGYVRNFARLTKARLDPELKIYIEYSNEVWNSMFPQTRHSWETAKELKLGDSDRPWEGGGMYYAKRSLEIFEIWEQVFGGRERLVRVLAWQAGNAWWMERIVLPTEDAYKSADVLAIAPYIGMNVPREGKELTAGEVATWSVDRVLDHVESHALPKAIDAIETSKRVADKFGLLLVAYEGGQHMVGVGGGENNEAMTKRFHEANAHPRMAGIYRKYYDAWTRAGGDLFCYFSSVGRWSKWGSWGILQYYDEDERHSPKFTSTMRWARRCGQPVHAPD